MTPEEYDQVVLAIHQLYEEMYSIQTRISYNTGVPGTRWNICLTLGGILTHGSSGVDIAESHHGIYAAEIVYLHLIQIYFQGNANAFETAVKAFQSDYGSVSGQLDRYLHAPQTSRETPIQELKAYLERLKHISQNSAYAAFFAHLCFKEYFEEAVQTLKINPENIEDRKRCCEQFSQFRLTSVPSR